MTMHEGAMRRIVQALTCLGLAGAAVAQGMDPRVQAAEARVRALVGDAPCRSDADCRRAPIGVLACGGPQGYIAWSVLNVQEADLHRALERHAALRRREIERTGESSTCMVMPVPAVACQRPDAAALRGRCVLQPPSPPAGAER
jgi:hypothetical protein